MPERGNRASVGCTLCIDAPADEFDYCRNCAGAAIRCSIPTRKERP